MDNPETLATMFIQDTKRRITNHENTSQLRKLRRWATQSPSKTPVGHVPTKSTASCKTLAVLIM